MKYFRKNKFLLLLICLALALIISTAIAEVNLSAERRSGEIVVSWPEACTGDATLTLYRDGWPLLCVSVDCAAGGYSIPSAYVTAPGAYTVRLRTAQGCSVVAVDGETKAEKPVATAALTAIPSAEPTATPTALPTATPTPAPTAVSTPAPTATPVPASGGSLSSLAAEVVGQVNQERAAQGLSPLHVDPDLSAAACVRAREIAHSFSHVRPDGRGWSTVSAKAYGENIAMGQKTADKVMAAWLSSPGHRENILRPSFGSIGVCAWRENGVIYWVQLFGK